jgi:hypothetical protein
MNTQKNTARLAGLIYLMVVLTGIFSLGYVPSRLIVWSNPERTFQNISSSRQLFRLSIASSMLCYIAFFILPFVLYKLLSPVNDGCGKLMVAFAVISVPISFINLQNKFSVLSFVTGSVYSNIYDAGQLQSQVMSSLDRYNSGILIVQIFWGLWLLPFGYLVYKSKFLPRVFGVLLMLGCAGYLITTFGETIIQNFDQSPVSKFITLPASVGEIGICLWLLIIGIKNPKNKNG